MSFLWRNRLRPTVLACLLVGVFVAPRAALACPGDCDGSGEVTVDELVTMITIALGTLAVDACAAGDLDGDGSVTVDEIVRALDAILNGCPASGSTPTPTPTASATDTATPTATATATPRDPEPAYVSFDFRSGASGWLAGFADYPEGQEEFYELSAEIAENPPGASVFGTAFRLSGNNHSDDLFMFLKARLGMTEGLRPNVRYEIAFSIDLATNAPSGCPGIGGAPGESVFLKAGASTQEPDTFVDGEGLLRMTVDKGDQSESGPAGVVLGHIANGLPCDDVDLDDPPFLRRRYDWITSPYPARTDGNGNLWLLVGTDSGFEGPTTIYYQRIQALLSPLPAE